MRVARQCSIRLSLLAVCLAASVSPLFAQVAAGEITGIVKDQAGGAVPGATVNRLCASGLSAAVEACHAIRAGEGDLFVPGASSR